jgi:hypothetical protein
VIKHLWYSVLALAALGFVAVVVVVGFNRPKSPSVIAAPANARPAYDCPSKVHQDCGFPETTKLTEQTKHRH